MATTGNVRRKGTRNRDVKDLVKDLLEELPSAVSYFLFSEWHPKLVQEKVNLSHVFAGQRVGVTQVGERIWLVTFMQYDLGYFDDETCRLKAD
jgi:hypothetical protein